MSPHQAPQAEGSAYQKYRAKEPKDKSWNDLEKAKIRLDIAKTIVSAVLAYVLFHLGNVYSDTTHQADLHNQQRIERADSLQRERDRLAAQYTELVKQRRVLWSAIGPDLFDVYCYFMHYDNWRDFSEADIISKKRRLDKQIFTNRPFLSDTLFNQFNGLMGAAFKQTRTVGTDLLLRTKPDHPRDKNRLLFTEEDNQDEIKLGYYQLQRIAAHDLNTELGNIQAELPKL